LQQLASPADLLPTAYAAALRLYQDAPAVLPVLPLLLAAGCECKQAWRFLPAMMKQHLPKATAANDLCSAGACRDSKHGIVMYGFKSSASAV
jgi:hypothetical protein